MLHKIRFKGIFSIRQEVISETSIIVCIYTY